MRKLKFSSLQVSNFLLMIAIIYRKLLRLCFSDFTKLHIALMAYTCRFSTIYYKFSCSYIVQVLGYVSGTIVHLRISLRLRSIEKACMLDIQRFCFTFKYSETRTASYEKDARTIFVNDAYFFLSVIRSSPFLYLRYLRFTHGFE